jgi:hypothetical protein
MTVLADAVQDRFDTQFLLEVTNQDPNATTINTTKLEAAVTDTIGYFQLETGITFDETNITHIAYCIDGVVAKLEHYKSRDGNIMTTRWKNFLGALRSMRTKVAPLPKTNSKIRPTKDQNTVRPDMDRNHPAFQYGSRNSNTQIQEFSGDN